MTAATSSAMACMTAFVSGRAFGRPCRHRIETRTPPSGASAWRPTSPSRQTFLQFDLLVMFVDAAGLDAPQGCCDLGRLALLQVSSGPLADVPSRRLVGGSSTNSA